MATLKITGMELINQRIAEVDKNLQRKGLIKAVKAGSEIILTDMKSRAPVDKGDLRESLGTKFVKRGIRRATQEIGPSQAEEHVARFNELGTAHQTARPFMLPALEHNAEQAQDAVGRAFWESIDEALG